jgi:ribose 5-phosphate isomerase A
VPVKLPVEIVQFCHNHVIKVITQKLSYQGCTAKLRLETDNKPTITDNGNYIVDLYFETTIVRPETIAADLEKITGVVEHGLFCNMAKVIVVANRDNTTTLIKKPLPSPIRF